MEPEERIFLPKVFPLHNRAFAQFSNLNSQRPPSTLLQLFKPLCLTTNPLDRFQL